MTTTMVIWLSVAVVMTSLILYRVMRHAVGHSPRRHLFEIGKESEEIWLPGDRLPSQSDEDDDDY